MSGMGGLALNASAIKLLIKLITSGLLNYNLQHNLVDRETPKAYYTKLSHVNVLMAEKKHSGMVKDNKILQWAIRMLVILTELQRQRLNRCGWMIKDIICLRYSPFLVGNFKDTRQQLESFLYCFLQDLSFRFNHFLIIHNKNEITSN
jgi:hypothetical protein